MNMGTLALVLSAGAMIAFQSPINASLAKMSTAFHATAVSFFVGLVCAIGFVLFQGGIAPFRNLSAAQPWQFAGGILGMGFVAAITLAVPRIGVAQTMVCALAAQLITAMVIDHFGWFGVVQKSLDIKRMAAIPLLFAAVWLTKK